MSMMKRKHDVILFAAVVLHVGFAGARAGDETTVAELAMTAGFRPHVLPCPGGQVNWTDGVIIAKGQGVATGVDSQAQLVARRAAELDAARNAVAIAAGIPLDAGGLAGAVGNGRVMLEGCVKGHDIDEESWLPANNPPEYHVTLRVPLWGVNGVASVFHSRLQRQRRQQPPRLPLVVDREDVSESILVIDARGTGLTPCLFPAIVTDTGETLYDVSAVPRDQARQRSLACYVETDMTFEEIQAAVEDGAMDPIQSSRTCVMLASLKAGDEPAPSSVPLPAPSATPPPAESPSPGESPAPAPSPGATAAPGQTPSPNEASEPDSADGRSRRRKRSAVKAISAGGALPAQIVLTRETADQLRKSAMGASLLRESKVVIVVDSVAAGIQGRLDVRHEGTAMALADGCVIESVESRKARACRCSLNNADRQMAGHAKFVSTAWPWMPARPFLFHTLFKEQWDKVSRVCHVPIADAR
jgi:hypothetical protein